MARDRVTAIPHGQALQCKSPGRPAESKSFQLEKPLGQARLVEAHSKIRLKRIHPHALIRRPPLRAPPPSIHGPIKADPGHEFSLARRYPGLAGRQRRLKRDFRIHHGDGPRQGRASPKEFGPRHRAVHKGLVDLDHRGGVADSQFDPSCRLGDPKPTVELTHHLKARVGTLESAQSVPVLPFDPESESNRRHAQKDEQQNPEHNEQSTSPHGLSSLQRPNGRSGNHRTDTRPLATLGLSKSGSFCAFHHAFESATTGLAPGKRFFHSAPDGNPSTVGGALHGCFRYAGVVVRVEL